MDTISHTEIKTLGTKLDKFCGECILSKGKWRGLTELIILLKMLFLV